MQYGYLVVSIVFLLLVVPVKHFFQAHNNFFSLHKQYHCINKKVRLREIPDQN